LTANVFHIVGVDRDCHPVFSSWRPSRCLRDIGLPILRGYFVVVAS
jgi:hypothetical protein